MISIAKYHNGTQMHKYHNTVLLNISFWYNSKLNDFVSPEWKTIMILKVNQVLNATVFNSHDYKILSFFSKSNQWRFLPEY